MIDLDGGNAEAAGLEHDADAAGRHPLPEAAHHAAGHQDVLHLAGPPLSPSTAASSSALRRRDSSGPARVCVGFKRAAVTRGRGERRRG